MFWGGMVENSSAMGKPVAAHVLKGLKRSGWSWGFCANVPEGLSAADAPSTLALKLP